MMTVSRGGLAKEIDPSWQKSLRPAEPGSLDFLPGFADAIHTAGMKSKSPASNLHTFRERLTTKTHWRAEASASADL
jgi:hypothetical protein